MLSLEPIGRKHDKQSALIREKINRFDLEEFNNEKNVTIEINGTIQTIQPSYKIPLTLKLQSLVDKGFEPKITPKLSYFKRRLQKNRIG